MTTGKDTKASNDRNSASHWCIRRTVLQRGVRALLWCFPLSIDVFLSTGSKTSKLRGGLDIANPRIKLGDLAKHRMLVLEN